MSNTGEKINVVNNQQRNGYVLNSSSNSIPPGYSVNGNIESKKTYHGNAYLEDEYIFGQKNDNGKLQSDIFYSVFNKSNITFVFWFLAIYLVAYIILKIFFNKDEDYSNYQLRLSRTIDILTLFFFVILVVSIYSSYNEKDRNKILENNFLILKYFIDDPISIVSLLFFILILYFVLYLFSVPMSRETKPFIVSIIETVVWVLLVIILFADFFKYVLGISLTDIVYKLFNWSTLPDKGKYEKTIVVGNTVAKVNTVTTGNTIASASKPLQPPPVVPPQIDKNPVVGGNTVVSGNPFVGSVPVQKNEVFNISNNLYTYDDAQSICSVYGAKLANYDQLEEAYNHGAEWCNYGWSDGQMAFFPTQKSTWKNLQNDPKKKNNCGRPGINGGYFANPYIKFGVNCYGKKPNPTDADLARMKANQQQVIQPKKPEDAELDEKVKFWKDNKDKLLQINSYNQKTWSEN
uniref:Link domain-containing protein n=1 Tax=viral metagenome TaxID=1070528 RepID=A0A6C0JEK5_9ZZZZ